jgi:tripartite-type tricarboxylate transporter receptor subunit TctC
MKSLICAVIAVAGLVAPLQAQQYPSKPVRVVLGLIPGGPVDTLARALAQSFTVNMGQSFIVENRAGGNLVIAAETVARAAPSGYTLLVTPEFAMTVNPSAYSALSYSPVKDFSAVSLLAVNNFTICSNSAKLPGAGFADMLAYAKAKPGELTYGVASTLSQLLVEQMKLEQRVDLLHVPYKGSADVVPALLAGQIDLAVGPLSAYAPLAKAGKARILVVTGPKRDAMAPEAPTLREVGLASLETLSWIGLFAPAGTPQNLVAKLNTEALKALAEPQLRAQLAKVGFDPVGSTPEALAATVKEDIARWAPLVKAAGIKFD